MYSVLILTLCNIDTMQYAVLECRKLLSVLSATVSTYVHVYSNEVNIEISVSIYIPHHTVGPRESVL